MSVTYSNFLVSAEVLLNNSDSQEIDFRNLISRSYYALFHLSKEIAGSLPEVEISNTGSHERVLNKFKYHPNEAFQKLADLMYKSKGNRVKADYSLNSRIVRLDAERHFYAVKGVITKLEQLKITVIDS